MHPCIFFVCKDIKQMVFQVYKKGL